MKYSLFANTIHKIVNDLYENKEIKYLELGLNCGSNFTSLLIENKKSVDIKFSQVKPTYLMTTDDFFEQNKDKFNWNLSKNNWENLSWRRNPSKINNWKLSNLSNLSILSNPFFLFPLCLNPFFPDLNIFFFIFLSTYRT